jgi:hypothetical protein
MASPLKLIGVFVVIVVLAVGGAAVAATAGGGDGGQPAGAEISGQSPAQFQPDAVNHEADPEEGEIDVAASDGAKRILVDTSHSNQISRSDVEPVVEAAFESGHFVEFGADGDSGSSYAETLSNYDALLVVQPRSGFSESERNAVQNYTDAGGRVAILGEPPQVQASLGLFGVPSEAAFGATNLTQSYGLQIGAEMLYNMNAEATDNNFKSIYAVPDADDELTDGVETVNFDKGGYVVVNEQHDNADDIEDLYTAADNTRTLDTRREGEYTMAVRTENLVLVADSTFIQESDVYDVDNEVLVGNLMDFLVSGELDENFPTDSAGSATEPPEPPEVPTPTPPEEATPTPVGESS